MGAVTKAYPTLLTWPFTTGQKWSRAGNKKLSCSLFTVIPHLYRRFSDKNLPCIFYVITTKIFDFPQNKSVRNNELLNIIQPQLKDSGKDTQNSIKINSKSEICIPQLANLPTNLWIKTMKTATLWYLIFILYENLFLAITSI